MNSTDLHVAVVLPAAGSGTRLGGQRKQFRTLGGDPLWLCTLKVFDRIPEIQEAVLAVPGPDIAGVKNAVENAPIHLTVKVVSGGRTRQESVRNGLLALSQAARIVLVHDAVRPFVRTHDVCAVIEKVNQCGSASLAVPVVDTLRKTTAEGLFAGTVDRFGLFRMQTPQGFSREILEHAHDSAAESGFKGTDDVELVGRLNYKVSVVPGRYENVKVTSREDWEFATGFWAVWEKMIEEVE